MTYLRSALPWHSLTSDEITKAVSALRASVGEEIRLNRISLLEPIKSDALAWERGATAARGADLIYRSNKQSYRATYDFGTQMLTEPEALSGGQPMLVGEELMGAVEAVNALPEIADAPSAEMCHRATGFACQNNRPLLR